MALKRNLNGQPAFIFYPTRRRNGGPALSTSTCGQQSGESPCAPPNPALLHLGQSLAWPTSNGCNDRDQTPVGRCQKALERPLRMKGETTETAVYALRTADIRLQPTGPQIDFERSVIWRFEKPCSKSITPLGSFIPNGPLRRFFLMQSLVWPTREDPIINACRDQRRACRADNGRSTITVIEIVRLDLPQCCWPGRAPT